MGQGKYMQEKEVGTKTILDNSTPPTDRIASQKLVENSRNVQDDDPVFDGNETPILDSDSDDDCYVINEDEIPTKSVPNEVLTSLSQENLSPNKEVKKSRKNYSLDACTGFRIRYAIITRTR